MMMMMVRVVAEHLQKANCKRLSVSNDGSIEQVLGVLGVLGVLKVIKVLKVLWVL
jgi:hypothetical protein